MVLRQNLSGNKCLNFKTGFKPKTWLSLRPFVNTGPVQDSNVVFSLNHGNM